MSSFRLGLLAEYFVIFIYLLFFYKILHHRYKAYVGEVDIIAVKGKNLIFIEVKARKVDIYEDIVSQEQIVRIRNAAKLFLSKIPRFINYNIRFDFVLVRPYKFPTIIKNAW